MKTSVLLAEDENSLQALLEEVLTDAGFDVVVASDGAQAMGRLDSAGLQLGVVVTDINLGARPDGWAVSRHARVLVPGMPVIYVSAHSINDWPSKGVPNSLFLSKPFKLRHIVMAVSTLLADADGRRTAGI